MAGWLLLGSLGLLGAGLNPSLGMGIRSGSESMLTVDPGLFTPTNDPKQTME